MVTRYHLGFPLSSVEFFLKLQYNPVEVFFMKKRYFVEPNSPLIFTAAAFLVISFALRLFWSIHWHVNDMFILLSQVVLPLFSCVLFLVFLFCWGKTKLWTTFIPTFLGVLFFILKATGFVWWHQLLCTLLYLLVAVLYGLAVFGIAPIKKLLIPLFSLPLAFHVFIEDFILKWDTHTAATWIQEISVLCIMAALLFISLAMKEPYQNQKEVC